MSAAPMPNPVTALQRTPRPDWHGQAACRDHPEPDLWHSDAAGRPGKRLNDRAKAVCRGCPVKAECLDTGLHQRHGIWGGLDPHERRQLRRAPTVHRDACGTDKGIPAAPTPQRKPLRPMPRSARRTHQGTDVTMPDIWLPFPRRELIAMRRCPDCGCHPPTQGHKAECPTTLNQQEERRGA